MANLCMLHVERASINSRHWPFLRKVTFLSRSTEVISLLSDNKNYHSHSIVLLDRPSGHVVICEHRPGHAILISSPIEDSRILCQFCSWLLGHRRRGATLISYLEQHTDLISRRSPLFRKILVLGWRLSTRNESCGG